MPTTARSLFAVLLVLASGACREDQCTEVGALDGPADVLVVGDSVFDWGSGRCASVPDHLSLARGRKVQNNAINGTRMLDGDGRIPGQLEDGLWRAVVIDGGGNDLNGGCGCDACDETLDALASTDGATGAMPELVDEVLARGIPVFLLRYYELPEGAWYGFDACDDVMAELGVRYEALAAARLGVTLVDARPLLPKDDHALFDFDLVHPSDEGAARLGAHLASVLDAR